MLLSFLLSFLYTFKSGCTRILLTCFLRHSCFEESVVLTQTLWAIGKLALCVLPEHRNVHLRTHSLSVLAFMKNLRSLAHLQKLWLDFSFLFDLLRAWKRPRYLVNVGESWRQWQDSWRKERMGRILIKRFNNSCFLTSPSVFVSSWIWRIGLSWECTSRRLLRGRYSEPQIHEADWPIFEMFSRNQLSNRWKVAWYKLKRPCSSTDSERWLEFLFTIPVKWLDCFVLVIQIFDSPNILSFYFTFCQNRT